MGLSVSVGDYAAMLREEQDVEWLEEQFAVINQFLKSNGLPTHSEPRDVPEIEYKSCVSFPYSYLHYLRRIYARHRLGKLCEPVAGGDLSPEDDKDIEQASQGADTHLLYHSDCEGFYVPIAFDSPILDKQLPGCTLGSTQMLLKELLEIAPLIGISLVDGNPTAEAIASLESFDEEHPFSIERLVWHCLFENCSRSMEYRGAILFA